MNVVIVVQDYIQRWKDVRERNAKLAIIPRTRLNGMNALPAELWSLVFEPIVIETLTTTSTPFRAVAELLELRKVCSVFNEETLYWLRKHIRLPHLRPSPLISPFLDGQRMPEKRSTDSQKSVVSHAELTAAALYNSFRRQDRMQPYSSLRIVHRMCECLRLAKYLHRKAPQSYDPDVLLQRLCTAASVSWYCHQYMYTPWFYYVPKVFNGHRTSDLHLEIALLVACGYNLEDVKKMLLLLARKGLLKGYTGYQEDRSRYSFQSRRIGLRESADVHYEYATEDNHLIAEGIAQTKVDSWEERRVQLEREAGLEYERMKMEERRNIAARRKAEMLRRMTEVERNRYLQLRDHGCNMPRTENTNS